MCNATTMYHTELNPLKKIKRDGERVSIPRGIRQRRLHKAILRYHDPKNWQTIRDALTEMGMHNLIGKGQDCLVPAATAAERRMAAPKGQKGKQGMTRFTSPKSQKMLSGKSRKRR
jgi:hypothetical protein